MDFEVGFLPFLNKNIEDGFPPAERPYGLQAVKVLRIFIVSLDTFSRAGSGQ